jgi:hypothetical protein
MAAQSEKVAAAALVGGAQTALHSHAGGGGSPEHGLMFGIRTGSTDDRRYAAGAIGATAIATGAAVANVLRVLPFIPPTTITVDRISCYVSTLVAGKVRLGIYANGDNLYPSTLLADSGELDTGTTGIKDATISASLTAGTLYWIGYNANAAATYRALATAALAPILGLLNATTPTWGVGWTVAYTYAALPANYPGSATVLAGGTMPIVAVRAA